MKNRLPFKRERVEVKVAQLKKEDTKVSIIDIALVTIGLLGTLMIIF
ncbi:hypothetical protein [Aquimarina rhabdastrellae]